MSAEICVTAWDFVGQTPMIRNKPAIRIPRRIVMFGSSMGAMCPPTRIPHPERDMAFQHHAGATLVVLMTDFPGSQTPHVFLAGGGEMGARIRAFDWSATPLGPIESWTPALRTMVSILLANRFPLLLWWGPDYVQIYNDAYIPVPGTKHPDRALGRPGSECW